MHVEAINYFWFLELKAGTTALQEEDPEEEGRNFVNALSYCYTEVYDISIKLPICYVKIPSLIYNVVS